MGSFSEGPKSKIKEDIMGNIYLSRVLILFLLCNITASCVNKQQSPQVNEQFKVNSIIVLPTDTIKNDKISFRQSKMFETGSAVLGNLIHQYFTNKDHVQFVSNEQQDALLTTYNQDRFTQAISIGKNLSGEAVLTSQINRYSEREGQEYSIDTPASISFEYRLMLVETGQTLCAGVFDETQKSWGENILFYEKIFNRGGKWITAEELAKEGLYEKFNSCRYF